MFFENLTRKNVEILRNFIKSLCQRNVRTKIVKIKIELDLLKAKELETYKKQR